MEIVENCTLVYGDLVYKSLTSRERRESAETNSARLKIDNL